MKSSTFLLSLGILMVMLGVNDMDNNVSFLTSLVVTIVGLMVSATGSIMINQQENE